MTLLTRQHGAAAILALTVMVLGVAWFAVGALGKAPIATAEREVVTGQALLAGKRALLAHIAQYAARSDTAEPGQLPCPESLTLATPGTASTACSAAALVVGRLPWKTLGIDELRDGQGEPLWYMMRGFRNAPINFDTPGQLTYDGSAVVAMVIAPGRPLNTLAQPGMPPAGCNAVDQQVGTRNSAPLNPANFLECGIAAGNIASPDSLWTNDRVLEISAAEWADAVAPAVSDRLQRQVVPAMMDYRAATSVTSWGESFLPNASTIDASLPGSQPESNNLCGNNNTRSGMPPTATVASGACNTNWTGGNASGLGGALAFGGCIPTASELQCDFTVVLGGLSSPRIDAFASRIGYSFRAVDPAQITIQINGGSVNPASTGNYASSVSAGDGSATMSFEVFFPLLSIADTVRIRIPHASDALLADARSAWYINNGWDRHSYYGVSRAATHDAGGSVCNPGGVITDCLTVNGMPAPANDKRLVLVLMGRQRAGTTQPSYTLSNYFERQNASVGVIYEVGSVDASFNDRVAACPFALTSEAGPVTLCN